MRVYAVKSDDHWHYRCQLQQIKQLEDGQMTIRTASAQALHDLTASGERARKTTLILATLQDSPHGLTRREIEDETGLRPNQVTGRVREMLDQDRLTEGRMRKCRVTGNVVNVVLLPELQQARK